MPELAPVVPLEMPELLYHQGWRRWQGQNAQGAIAAQVGRAQLRVRDTANQIVVVEKIVVSSSATGQFSGDFGYGPAALDLATLVTAYEFRDGRQTPSANSNDVILSQDTNAAATTTAFNFFTVANTPYEVPGAPWVLFPGNQILVNNNVVNQPILVTWVWRSRILQEQENTP